MLQSRTGIAEVRIRRGLHLQPALQAARGLLIDKAPATANWGRLADETLAKCAVAANTPEGLSFENQHRCKDGSLRDRHISNRPVEVRGRVDEPEGEP